MLKPSSILGVSTTLGRVSGALSRVVGVAGAALVLLKAREVFFPRTIQADRIYNTRQVARYLGVSREQVREMIESGEIAARQVNDRYLILGRAVTAFLADTTHPPPDAYGGASR